MLLMLSLAACSAKQEQVSTEKTPATETAAEAEETVQQASVFGETVPTGEAIMLADLSTEMSATEQMENVVLKGEVTGVCQKKGCWMTLKNSEGKDVRVTFKDYALFMPKDISGKEVVIHGVAKKEEISVDDLRHYAEDAGKSSEEIAAITEPGYELTFEADGVVIN